MATVFAGADVEATARARSYFAGYAPSSPSIGFLRDGKLEFMLERRQIENQTAEQIVKNREQIKVGALDLARKKIGPALVVEDIVIENIALTRELERAIEQKMVQEQEAAKAKFTQLKAQIEADTAIAMATLEEDQQFLSAVKSAFNDYVRAAQEIGAIQFEIIALRDQQIAESTANLQIKQAEYHRSVEVARIQAVKAKEVRETELQAEVEQAVEFVELCMRIRPEWAKELPLNCESGYGESYGDC